MNRNLKYQEKAPIGVSNVTETDFSFANQKTIYENSLYGQEKYELIIENKSDFWKFVHKYESMIRSAGQQNLCKNEPVADSSTEVFQKRNIIPFLLYTRTSQLLCQQIGDPKYLSLQNIQEFQEIILIYLDFRQKEKFSKIKKIRRAQKNLPIYKYRNEIEKNLKHSRVLIIAGDTGCGKSTQIPQILYKCGYRNIACTQPRRLACVSLSKRVAHEMLDDYGSKVGFQIRFEKSKTLKTNILFITEGLLLRQLAVESNINLYDVLILDEIHERNLFGDFLLGVTKCLLRAKPNLRLILMSATVNVNLFHSYFQEEGASLVEVPGRLYPIKTIFKPPPSLELKHAKNGHSNNSGRLDPAPYVQVLNLIDQKHSRNERGDVLIFVSGVNEITTLCDAIKEYSEQNANWIILPLHSGLSLTEQDKVFDYAPDGMRKCIVSTNIAETSLTVDGIRFVIDSGKVKEMSYDSTCKGQRLKEFWVSQSSAEQRKGRAGRTGPGVCFRLFSEKQYLSFNAYPTPEIFRVPLDTILLQMIAMGLPNVRTFPFVETPSEESIEHTILSLKKHNALTPDEKITPLGKALSNLPVEISIGKMLLMGCVFPDVEKILTLTAAMSVQNPFTNRAFTDPKCEQEKSSLESDHGDIFTILNIFNEWLHKKIGKENTPKWCHKLGIEEQRLYEIAKLRNQFKNILESCNMTSTRSVSNNISSADRARRHGEVRILKGIKRKQKYQEPRKRKILKHYINTDDDDFENNDNDIRDVNFRLNHDTTKMELLLKSSNIGTARDVLLLKLIILSGLYPQVAIADDFNYCKGGNQQFFHTSLKPFLSIHPNACFAKHYQLLNLNESNILQKPSYYTPKALLSKSHQIICYQNLLETAKPYLMNCIRIPAAQALLLFSYSIDTNTALTRIVCDSWLCLDFPTLETGCDLLFRAIKLRRMWTRLLTQKLYINSVGESSTKQTKNTDKCELSEHLVEFMSVNISFTIKRLLPADLKNLYTHGDIDNYEQFRVNPFAEDFPISRNKEKGGINVSENVVYGCLNDVQWTVEMNSIIRQQSWICTNCNEEKKGIIARILHKKTCFFKNTTNEHQSSPLTTGKEISYHCRICQKKLYLTKIDILKHKKYCK